MGPGGRRGTSFRRDFLFLLPGFPPSLPPFRKLARLSLAREGGIENGRNVCLVVVVNVIQGTTTVFTEEKFCEVGLGS